MARFVNLRLFCRNVCKLHLQIYQGDVNTAYVKYALTIEQYMHGLKGYPCEQAGQIYMVNKALFGLRQSVRM